MEIFNKLLGFSLDFVETWHFEIRYVGFDLILLNVLRPLFCALTLG